MGPLSRAAWESSSRYLAYARAASPKLAWPTSLASSGHIGFQCSKFIHMTVVNIPQIIELKILDR